MVSRSLTSSAEAVPRGEFRHKNPFLDATGDSCPIHKLPVEILSYLFEVVADGLRNASTRCVVLIDKHRPSSVVPDFQSAALTPWLPVSRVCRSWHDIAFSTPSLWAVIHIPPRTRSCPSFCSIAMQLERSKEFPLDIRIHLDKSSNYSGVFLHTICNTLLTQVHRWHSIEVEVTWAEHMYEILDAISKAHIPIAPQLRSVMLISSLDDDMLNSDYIKSKQFMLFRSSAPHLKTISLMGVNIDWNQPWISSASDLVALEICVTSVPSWIQFATILRGAPNLQVLMFDDVVYDPYSDIDSDWNDSNVESSGNNSKVVPIKLPRLRQLHISPYARAVQIFRSCYIPALKELTISSHYLADQGVIDVLVAQLIGPQAVTCPLASKPSESGLHTQNQSLSLLTGVEQLYIYYTFRQWSTGHIDSVYCILNQLTSLSLGGPYEPTFIDLLFTPTGQLCDVRLPQLKTLEISYGPCSTYYIRHICALAWHRKDTGVPLRTVVFTEVRRGTFPKDCLLWFQENLETFTSLEYY